MKFKSFKMSYWGLRTYDRRTHVEYDHSMVKHSFNMFLNGAYEKTSPNFTSNRSKFLMKMDIWPVIVGHMSNMTTLWKNIL